MYTSYIGRKFLKLFNEKNKTNYSAEDFFTEIQFPIFFDDKKHMMHVHGSTFFQSINDEDINKAGGEPLARLNRLKKDINDGKISGSTYVGYAAGKVDAVTSGQVSSLRSFIDKEEVYSSWIGQGFAIGLKGGLLFVDDEALYWRIFIGWKLYRKYLSQTPNLKARQIETWNGHWLFYCSRFSAIEEIDVDEFNIDIDTSETGIIPIPTLSWFKVMLSFTAILGSRSIVGNAFVASKVNSSFGFINLILPEIKKFYELRDKIFMSEDSTILKEEEIEELSTFYNFKDACKSGTIGLKAIEPAKLRQFMPKGSVQYAQGKEFQFNNEESYKQYQLYKIWIIAMLNKTELLKTAADIAEILVEIESQQEGSSRGTKKTSQESKGFLEIKTMKAFIDGLTTLIDKSDKKTEIKNCLDEVLKMPVDSFPLFMALIRFEYSYKTK